jgi:hypothetical protein
LIKALILLKPSVIDTGLAGRAMGLEGIIDST